MKVDTERLESLSREKTHADKLKSRIKTATATISRKEAEYEELRRVHEKLVAQNQRLQDSATRFRETFLKVENLEEKAANFEQELKEALVNLEELPGSRPSKPTMICDLQTSHPRN